MRASDQLLHAVTLVTKPPFSGDPPVNILIVDDEPKNLTVLETILEDPGHRFVRAHSADEALLALVADEFALLILDISMPDMTGFELAQFIKERKKTAHVPIIFLTAYYNEDQHVLEGYGSGAVDYLHKPVNPAILRSKVAVFVELYRKNRALAEEVASRLRVEAELRDLNATLEQRVAERTKEVRENQSRLLQASDAARLTFVEVDFVNGKARTANNFASVMGYALPQAENAEIAAVIGRLLGHVVPQDRPLLEGALQQFLAGKPVHKIQYRIQSDDRSERWIESKSSVDYGSEGQPLKAFLINLDITSHKHTEEQLRRANLDLEQFAYSASHDLQEPLRNIAIYCQLLERTYTGRLGEQADLFLGYVIEASQRMGNLLSDLLKYTQAVSLDGDRIARVEAGRVLDAVLRGLQHTIEENQARVTAGPLPTVLLSEVHLHQILQNLVGNALKYRQDKIAPEVSVSATLDQGIWRFSVKDNGIGIAASHQSLVFGIFKRLHPKEKYAGTGIGLAICQKTVERYGGRIWVESDGVGCGSTFHFTVPGAPEDYE
jgi:signal transduction histidine kinase